MTDERKRLVEVIEEAIEYLIDEHVSAGWTDRELAQAIARAITEAGLVAETPKAWTDALTFIAAVRPGRWPHAETTEWYNACSDVERAAFDRGKMHGYSRAWDGASDHARKALANPKGEA